jgi:hypothetical protein
MTTEAEEMRAEILEELGPVLIEQLAADEWGRLLVAVVPRGETFVVSHVDVEDLVGSEARVEQALGGPAAREVLPLLAHACEALAATFEVDLAEVEGGTFLRRREGGFAFLPGLVHAPSEAFDRLAEERVPRVLARQEALHRRGVTERFELDLEAGRVSFDRDDGGLVTARAVLLGTYAQDSRTWGWAWANPSLGEAVTGPSRRLCDEFPQRDAWEISTPQFATDPGTAWALAAVLAEEAGAEAIYRAPHPGGLVFLLLFDLREREG